jgi:hypothetical protein
MICAYLYGDTSREAFDSVLSELVQSGMCVLSMSDGVVMIQCIDSFPVSAAVSSLPEPPPLKAVKSDRRSRPLVPEHLKRVVINHVRLPLWLSEHLKANDQAGKAVEKALIHFYNLAPP